MDQDSAPVVIAPLIAQSFDEDARALKPTLLVPKTARCPQRAPDEIVVCAQDPETFRLRPLSQEFADDEPARARLKLSEGASVGAEVERAGVGGHISNRVMVRGRIKF